MITTLLKMLGALVNALPLLVYLVVTISPNVDIISPIWGEKIEALRSLGTSSGFTASKRHSQDSSLHGGRRNMNTEELFALELMWPIHC